MAFINTFGYDMQKTLRHQFLEITEKVNNRQVLQNLAYWLSKLGFKKQREVNLLISVINEVLKK